MGLDLPGENALPVAYPACPPIRLVVCFLQNRDDFTLLEAKIASLIRVESKLCDGLVGAQTRLPVEDGLRCRRSAGGGGAVAVGIVVVEGRRTAAAVHCIECLVGVGAGGEGAVEATSGVGLAVVDVVGPGGRALWAVAVLVLVVAALAVLAALAERACAVSPYAFAHGRAATALPHDVVVRVVVHGDVVVHAVVGCGRATYAREDSGVEHAQQRLGGRRGRDLAAQQLSRGPSPPVQLLVCVSALDQPAAFQTDTGEQALCLAVAEDARHALQTGHSSRLRVPADRPGRDGDVAAECQGAGLGECAYCRGVVQDEDEVSQLEADLPAEPAADGADG